MRVTCPKCQLKGMVDTGPLMLQTRILCVRCATSYEAMLVDDAVETFPASSNDHPQAWEAVDWNSDAPLLEHELIPDEPLELPVLISMEGALMNTEPVLEDLLTEPPFKHDLSLSETTIAPVQEEHAEDEALVMAEAQELSSTETTVWPQEETSWPCEETASASEEETVSTLPSEAYEALPSEDAAPPVVQDKDEDEITSLASSAPMDSSSTFESLVLPVSESEADQHDSLLDVSHAPQSEVFIEEQPVGFVHTSKDVLPYHDKNSLGVRLMRVSPVWLLGSGLLFISLIFVFNWATKPNAQANNLTLEHSLTSSAPNQAIHQTESNHATDANVAPATNNAAPSTNIAPAANSAPQVNPAPATKAAPVSSTTQSDNNESGNYTVQVGSYNDGAQAQERAVSLKAAGFDARVVEVQLPKRGTWYRVQTGRFGTREEAARYGQQLRTQKVAAENIITETQNR